MYDVYFKKYLVDGLVDHSYLDENDVLHNLFYLSAHDKKLFPEIKDFDVLDCTLLNNSWQLKLCKRDEIQSSNKRSV